ncbi:flagellar basal-body rod protein FlgF [Aestuariivirga sp.]|uniref:flagellar basal-body rod protein FlgF n=1 Tax=Aestuariivirga sp. TaxID=2650926 RepID=UPI0039193B18
MDMNSPVGLSGLLALSRRLDSIANNVANAGTAGFRAEAASFSTIVSKTNPFATSFAFAGGSHLDSRSGEFTNTGNPLDVAVQGPAFLAIETPQGTAYTRDGRMQMLPTGDLVSLNGHPVLDAGGAPLTANPQGGPIEIARDGTVRQDGRAIGTLGLYELDLRKGYSRYENAAVIPRLPPEPVESFTGNGVVQGFVEGSNVNAILEMTRLIEVQRAFEAVSASLEQRDGSLRDTIQALGARQG